MKEQKKRLFNAILIENKLTPIIILSSLKEEKKPWRLLGPHLIITKIYTRQDFSLVNTICIAK